MTEIGGPDYFGGDPRSGYPDTFHPAAWPFGSGPTDLGEHGLRQAGMQPPPQDYVPVPAANPAAEQQPPAELVSARVRWLNLLRVRRFGELMDEEFGFSPLADSPDAAAPVQAAYPAPIHNRGKLQFEYTDSLNHAMEADEIATNIGLPVELAATPEDAAFCHDFLALMKWLDFPNSLALPPATLNPQNVAGVDAEEWAALLLEFTKPTNYADPAGRMRASALDPFRIFYQTFIQALTKRATACAEPLVPNDMIIRGYPLRPLNEAATLYLCEDGGMRVGTAQGWLPAPMPATAHGVWHLDIDPTYEKLDNDLSSHYPYAASGGQDYPSRCVGAYPPKERLLDIAGQALGLACQTDRQEWQDGQAVGAPQNNPASGPRHRRTPS